MKSKVHDIVIPCTDGTPDTVQACATEIDDLGRQLPYVRIKVKLKDAEKAVITELRQRAKRILERRTDAAKAAVAADPKSTPSLDAPVADEDNA